MAMMDSDHRQSHALPSIQHLDLDKIKTDHLDHQRYAMMNSSAPLGSPTTVYSGPPPPYSTTASATPTVPGMSGYISPPQSTRRSTRDEKDSPGLPKSLPSISEALGDNRSMPFPSPASVVPPPTSSHHTTSAPTAAVGQAFPDAPKGPSNPFSQPLAPASAVREVPFTSQAPVASVLNHEIQRPQSHFPMINTSDPVPHQPQHNGYPQSPRYPPGPQSQYNSPYENGSGQSNNQSPHNYPTPRSSYPFSNGYQAHPRIFPQPSEPPHFEQPSYHDDRRGSYSKPPPGQPPYAENVKRELDVFDAETALKDIADASSRTLDFSRAWSQRSYQARNGFYAETLPSLNEIEDMMEYSDRVMQGLNRIREVVIAQQNALSEQRIRAARNPYDEYGSLDGDYKMAGGFAGGDAKKRRGKAAPPGRCHSCNRAETPEWRRGPDGARTLCNACGLHYAKLTRKMGPNKAAALTGSNLRPKSLDPRSPLI